MSRPLPTQAGATSPDSERRETESRLNATISRVLTVGLAVAIVVLLVGIVLAAARPGLPALHKNSIPDIPRAVGAFEPGGFFELGLLLLLATPAARVVALLVGSARRKAWLFSALSLVVLIVLALSMLIGLRG